MVHDIHVGPRVPRRGNALSRGLGALVLRLLGWRIVGELPDVPKLVVIVAPHTSNRDGVVGIAAVLALGLRMTLLGKHTLFRGPFGAFMRWLGAVPVNREQGGGVVATSLEKFREREQMFLGMAPEGTRHAPEEWKTGFWHIASQAGVPILVVGFDYGRRQVRILKTLTPGTLEHDMHVILECYRGIVPARPERLSRPLRRLMEEDAGRASRAVPGGRGGD